MKRELITFEASNELFGLDINAIREIRAWSPVTRMPKVPDYVAGVVNLRGAVLPVIDLSARLGWQRTEATQRHAIIVVQIDSAACGFIVESVSDIVELDLDGLQPPPTSVEGAAARFIEGIAPVNDQLITVLDPISLIEDGHIAEVC